MNEHPKIKINRKRLKKEGPMITYIRRLFSKETTNQPSLPIKETRSLTKVEIEFIINELIERQMEFFNEVENERNSRNDEDLEFNKLITNRLINNLKYKIPFLEIELVYLNNVLRGKKTKALHYKLFHQVKDADSAHITDMVINQGYSFVPTVGYLKIG
jgi:hypothetical protein